MENKKISKRNKKELFSLMDNPAKVKGTMPKHRKELYD
jgi:hypothetical protein